MYIYNNKLYNTDILSSYSIELPLLTYSASNISINYGNGAFLSGIWENGIWENGWRSDNTLTRCILYPIANYIKMSTNTHRVQFNILDISNLSLFNIGDYVSVGNIIAMDINNNRKLIKDKFQVISIGSNNIVLEIILNYPILQITQDSTYHLIYISKNIWLSGIFLNGNFNGIWNYGLFKGYPHITSMKNSHWVDGIFDGGHFMSTTNSVYNTYKDITTVYNTGLIQNFNFTDNNIAPPFGFTYSSWIDVNYNNTSMTNTSNQIIYATVSQTGFDINPYKYSVPDLNGYITYDVLSSNSNIRQGNSSIINNLKLGVKYTKYTNFIPNNGLFVDSFSTVITPPGLNNFFGDGWTFSLADSVSSGRGGSDITLANFDYYAATNNYFLNMNIPLVSSGDRSSFKLDNSNVNILSNRYSMVEVQQSVTRSSAGGCIIFTSLTKATYSSNSNYINYSNPINYEYFYNKIDLGLYIDASVFSIPGNVLISFPEISIIEVDMIPFFQLCTTFNNVDQLIRTPWVAVAPFINYNNGNYNYIGSANLLLSSAAISSPTTVYNANNSGNMLSTQGHI